MPIAWFGAIFALGAFALLLCASISTPVVHSFSFLNVNLGSTLYTFGAWGYCQSVNGVRQCTSRGLGYQIGDLLNSVTNDNEEVRGQIVHGLTYAVGVLNPIACGLALIGFLFAAGGHIISHILGSIVCFFAFIVAVVALGVDLGTFVTARHRFNDTFDGTPAELGNAMWFVVGAVCALFIASLTVCCGGIRDRKAKRSSSYAADPAYQQPVMAQRTGFARYNPFARRQQPVY